MWRSWAAARRRPQAEASAAGCLLVPLEWPSPSYRTVIRVPEPRTAFARAMSRFYPTAELKPGMHPTAVVGQDVELGAHGVHRAARRGRRRHAHRRGQQHRRRLRRGQAGRRWAKAACCIPTSRSTTTWISAAAAILHPGAVIGADGFGYVMEDERWHKFPQVGRVEIGDFVEIGANSCVDRAALGVTSIGEGTKLDNMVHVGHNCRIGRHVVVAAQTGFSGGVVVEDYAVIGGQVGIGDKARIESRAVLGSGCGVLTSKIVRSGRDGVGHAGAAAASSTWSSWPTWRALPEMRTRTGRDEAPPGGVGEESLMLVVVGGHSRNIGKTSRGGGLDPQAARPPVDGA